MVEMEILVRSAQDATPAVAPPHLYLDGRRNDARVSENWLRGSNGWNRLKEETKDPSSTTIFDHSVDELEPSAIRPNTLRNLFIDLDNFGLSFASLVCNRSLVKLSVLGQRAARMANRLINKLGVGPAPSRFIVPLVLEQSGFFVPLVVVWRVLSNAHQNHRVRWMQAKVHSALEHDLLAVHHVGIGDDRSESPHVRQGTFSPRLLNPWQGEPPAMTSACGNTSISSTAH
mgnify:CR=1 FL=1